MIIALVGIVLWAAICAGLIKLIVVMVDKRDYHG